MLCLFHMLQGTAIRRIEWGFDSLKKKNNTIEMLIKFELFYTSLIISLFSIVDFLSVSWWMKVGCWRWKRSESRSMSYMAFAAPMHKVPWTRNLFHYIAYTKITYDNTCTNSKLQHLHIITWHSYWCVLCTVNFTCDDFILKVSKLFVEFCRKKRILTIEVDIWVCFSSIVVFHTSF